jgi:hypothetical protein
MHAKLGIEKGKMTGRLVISDKLETAPVGCLRAHEQSGGSVVSAKARATASSVVGRFSASSSPPLPSVLAPRVAQLISTNTSELETFLIYKRSFGACWTSWLKRDNKDR